MSDIADNVYQAAYETEHRKRQAAEKERDKAVELRDRCKKANQKWGERWDAKVAEHHQEYEDAIERRTKRIESKHADKIAGLEAKVEKLTEEVTHQRNIRYALERKWDHIEAVIAGDDEADWSWPCVRTERNE